MKRPRSPNGTRRTTTLRPKRNLVTLDFGEDVYGIRRALEEKAQQECRSVSSLAREILKRALVDGELARAS